MNFSLFIFASQYNAPRGSSGGQSVGLWVQQ